MNLWDKTVNALQGSVRAYDFVHWIQPVRCADIDDSRREITLLVQDDAHGRVLEEAFLPAIKEAMSEVTARPYDLKFRREDEVAKLPIQASEGELSNPIEPEPEPEPSLRIATPPPLIARYRFDGFVDGPNNQFALTAARAVAERIGTRYNPLFIYGGVGLGKTHLLHAIGHAVYEEDPSTRVCYVSSETYVNDLISAIRKDQMNHFRKRYRDECDVLLIDDIQFIAGKDRTQEEFFHMFNELHSSHKQIVLTSDKLPRSIPDMEDRLKSRLEWGLIADIKPPSFETRVAILSPTAEADGYELSDDVAMLLRRHVSRNVRELEGALMRLQAHARIFNTKITLGMAREVLGDLVDEDVRRVSIETILKTVAHEYRLSVGDLKGPRRHRNVTIPRQAAMFLSRELTDASLPQIGASFGGRDHTTVINALKRTKSLRDADPEFRNRLDGLRRQLVS